MKKFLLVLTVLLFVFFMVGCENSTSPLQSDNQTTGERSLAKKGGVPANDGCTTIPSGELLTSTGEVITPGFNDFGYNYQAHLYNGDFGYPGWKLVMKWNDAWLSNKDCDGDGKLDRPLDEDGNQYYFGSGAWVTNHWTTTYENEAGEKCSYSEFIKIVAVPEDAVLAAGYWYNSDGVEIGQSIWGQFAIIQYVVDDPCAGVTGVQYKSPDHPGLGNW